MSTPALRDFTFTSVTVDPAGKAVDRPAGSGRFYAEDLGSLDLDMVAIKGGTFVMGSPADEPARSPMEGPQREVSVPDFFISRYPVTQAQYAALIGHNPAQSQVDNNPVECVNWFDAKAFCQRLERPDRAAVPPALRGRVGVRLPGRVRHAVRLRRRR